MSMLENVKEEPIDEESLLNENDTESDSSQNSSEDEEDQDEPIEPHVRVKIEPLPCEENSDEQPDRDLNNGNVKDEPEHSDATSDAPFNIKIIDSCSEIRTRNEPDESELFSNEVKELNSVFVTEENIQTEAKIDEKNHEHLIKRGKVYYTHLNLVDLNDLHMSKFRTDDHQYKCPVCEKLVPYKSHFERHLRIHAQPMYECNICHQTYRKKEIFDKHSCKTHPCKKCHKIFKTTSNLQQHDKTQHSEKPYKCDNCLKAFLKMDMLKKHKSKQRCQSPLKEPLKCEVCFKMFEAFNLYQHHLKTHAEQKPFQCDRCLMFFKHKTSLARHWNLHFDISKTSCPTCKKKFNHSTLLKQHMRVHTGERPYACPVCSKTFSYKHNMKKHALLHNKPKKLVCEVCSKKFPKESRLIYHMRTHTTEQPFRCKVCPKRFSFKQNILRHYQSKHPHEKFETDITDALFAKELYKHIEGKQIPLVCKKIHEKYSKSQEVKDETVDSKQDLGTPPPPIEEVTIKIEPIDYSYREAEQMAFEDQCA